MLRVVSSCSVSSKRTWGISKRRWRPKWWIIFDNYCIISIKITPISTPSPKTLFLHFLWLSVLVLLFLLLIIVFFVYFELEFGLLWWLPFRSIAVELFFAFFTVDYSVSHGAEGKIYVNGLCARIYLWNMPLTWKFIQERVRGRKGCHTFYCVDCNWKNILFEVASRLWEKAVFLSLQLATFPRECYVRCQWEWRRSLLRTCKRFLETRDSLVQCLKFHLPLQVS